MSKYNESANVAVSVLAVFGMIAGLVAILFLVVPGRSSINEVVTEEPGDGVRWQVTQEQRAGGMKVRVLTDLEYEREYLVVDWGEGTGVTPLLPPADTLSTESAPAVTLPAD